MATKKASTTKKRVSKATSPGKKVVKKVAKTLLGRIAQTGAQLIIDSGVLGKLPPPKKASKKKASKKKASKKKTRKA